MGGCVVSFMDKRNDRSIIPNAKISDYQAYGPQSVAVPQSETETSTAIYRNGKHHSDASFATARERLRTANTQVGKLYQICGERRDKTAIMYRTVESVRSEMRNTPDGPRMLDVTHLSTVRSLTYGQLWDTITHFSRGLATLGLPARAKVTIYEDTRWEWLASAYGIWLQDMIVTTVYANLGEQALTYALSETESKLIISNGKNVRQLVQGMIAGDINACTIIYLDALPADSEDVLSDMEVKVGSRILAWNEVVSMGADTDGGAGLPVQIIDNNDSVALIMYTSGTTGNPKGVVHTHGSIAAGIAIMDDWFYSLVTVPEGGTYCSYLPMAHILEFGVVNIFLARGLSIGFGSPRTLTDTTTEPHGDLREYKPAAFIGVPRIFDTIKKAIEAKLPPPGSFKRQIFDRAYESRLAALKDGMDTPFYNDKVFKSLRDIFGGRVQLTLCGGGPLSASTQEFCQVVFSDLVIGWGLTETVCVGAIQRLGDLEPICTGQVLYAEELRLVDTDSYRHTDQPEPRGEICLRGPFLFKEYYKQPEMTAEVLDKEGWFHTGDIGKMSSSGKLSIIGRIKALAKNAHGEYIALEALESIYAGHMLVLNNCICVLVNPYKHYVSALLLTDQTKAEKFAKENDISDSYPELLSNEQFRNKVLEALRDIAVRAKRRPFEIVKYVRIVDDEWTAENGLLSASMKLRRDNIMRHYKNDVDELFCA